MVHSDPNMVLLVLWFVGAALFCVAFFRVWLKVLGKTFEGCCAIRVNVDEFGFLTCFIFWDSCSTSALRL